uniref:Uncharacterized protein n=1 Tax=Chromera velia CCMP2878 TaxID=1169474 RepID=A0A0G4HT93_9ALVE|eukprot:Cvel_8416.t1-p1 / transcript=Cvel_8416.t1 / gene=Cvel_8416 / organism=Chromera_velia_CCMP2878 / gene_product=hypothetical protein / transcript_product=hypothetical protein / location=Cvel_scaffold464:80389-84789(-) / protein_length=742 / sequence_SO=supercontig / SO=protein_coding / is_pseudo=false
MFSSQLTSRGVATPVHPLRHIEVTLVFLSSIILLNFLLKVVYLPFVPPTPTQEDLETTVTMERAQQHRGHRESLATSVEQIYDSRGPDGLSMPFPQSFGPMKKTPTWSPSLFFTQPIRAQTSAAAVFEGDLSRSPSTEVGGGTVFTETTFAFRASEGKRKEAQQQQPGGPRKEDNDNTESTREEDDSSHSSPSSSTTTTQPAGARPLLGGQRVSSVSVTHPISSGVLGQESEENETEQQKLEEGTSSGEPSKVPTSEGWSAYGSSPFFHDSSNRHSGIMREKSIAEEQKVKEPENESREVEGEEEVSDLNRQRGEEELISTESIENETAVASPLFSKKRERGASSGGGGTPEELRAPHIIPEVIPEEEEQGVKESFENPNNTSFPEFEKTPKEQTTERREDNAENVFSVVPTDSNFFSADAPLVLCDDRSEEEILAAAERQNKKETTQTEAREKLNVHIRDQRDQAKVDGVLSDSGQAPATNPENENQDPESKNATTNTNRAPSSLLHQKRAPVGGMNDAIMNPSDLNPTRDSLTIFTQHHSSFTDQVARREEEEKEEITPTEREDVTDPFPSHPASTAPNVKNTTAANEKEEGGHEKAQQQEQQQQQLQEKFNQSTTEHRRLMLKQTKGGPSILEQDPSIEREGLDFEDERAKERRMMLIDKKIVVSANENAKRQLNLLLGGGNLKFFQTRRQEQQMVSRLTAPLSGSFPFFASPLSSSRSSQQDGGLKELHRKTKRNLKT